MERANEVKISKEELDNYISKSWELLSTAFEGCTNIDLLRDNYESNIKACYEGDLDER